MTENLKKREDIIGADWIAYETLKTMATVNVIDHALYCQKRAAENLARPAYHNEHPDGPRAQWAAYRNQVMWCLEALRERGLYTADPYRDEKGAV